MAEEQQHAFFVCDRCGLLTRGEKAPTDCPHCEYASFSAFADEKEALAAAELNAGFDETIDERDREDA